MSVTLESLAQRLAVLEDIEAIRTLKARYLRACDLKQVETVRECFAAGPVRIAYAGFPEFTERDAFVAVYESMACQGGVFDIHHATNSEIAITGPVSATGKWALNFRTILMGPRQVVRLAVEYEDVYRRDGGRWLIVETVSKVTSQIVEQLDEEGRVTIVAVGDAPGA